MAYDLGLAQRVREALGKRAGVSERAMFGGLAFWWTARCLSASLGPN